MDEDQNDSSAKTAEIMISSQNESNKRKEQDDDSILEELVCWKCKGHGKKRVKNHPKNNTENHNYVGSTCPVCQGTGKRPATERSKRLAQQPGIIQKLRGRNGVFAGVPAVKQEYKDPSTLVSEGEILAALGCGDWRILQLTNGHKLTVDDFICAWVASEEMRKRGFGVQDGEFGQVPSSNTNKIFHHADIGCGCGSVLMTMLWAFPQTIRSHGVEAQQVSYDLCRRGLLWNLGVDVTKVAAADECTEVPTTHSETDKDTDSTPAEKNPPVVQLTHQDLRAWSGSSLAPFDLVTGTPPYFPQDRFVASENHAQKIRCRIPTRGAASDYIEAAARLVKPTGVICIVETARKEAEVAVMDTIQKVQLSVLRRLDVITRTGLPPRFSCWVLSPSTAAKQNRDEKTRNNQSSETKDVTSFPIETLTIRNTDQSRTLEYVEALDKMGWVDFERTKEKFLARQQGEKENVEELGTTETNEA